MCAKEIVAAGLLAIGLCGCGGPGDVGSQGDANYWADKVPAGSSGDKAARSADEQRLFHLVYRPRHVRLSRSSCLSGLQRRRQHADVPRSDGPCDFHRIICFAGDVLSLLAPTYP